MKFSPSTNNEHLAIMTKKVSNQLVLKSDEELVESLKTLPDDIDFNHVDGDFNTLLYLASANNYSKTVEYLLNTRKVSPDIKVTEKLTAAHIAASSGHTEVLSQLVKANEIKLSEKDAYEETPLFRAIGNAPDKKLLDTVNLILKKDDSAVNMTNEDGIYPIEVALQRTKPDIIKLLLDHKADVSQRCYQSATDRMIHESKPSSQFGGAMVFFLGSTHNEALRECAKLITERYNSIHFVEETKKSSKTAH